MATFLRAAGVELSILSLAGCAAATGAPSASPASTAPQVMQLNPADEARIDQIATNSLRGGITGAIVSLSDPVKGS